MVNGATQGLRRWVQSSQADEVKSNHVWFCENVLTWPPHLVSGIIPKHVVSLLPLGLSQLNQDTSY